MRDPDRLLRRAGITGDASRDQHFLVDDRVLDRLPTYLLGRIDDDRAGTVLEIGAGTGALTDRLLSVADHVVAIERARVLVEFLREEFRSEIEEGRLTIVHGDALAVEIPDFDASISNLPYGISSEVAFRLLPYERPLLLMFQREFAERMIAQPGTHEYGRLSVTTQYYATPEIVETVPKEAFSPPPAVESAVVRLLPRSSGFDVSSEDQFFALVKAVFTQRRKTLRNAIRNTIHISGIDDPNAVLDRLDESLLSKRPDAITPTEFATISNVVSELGGPRNTEEGSFES